MRAPREIAEPFLLCACLDLLLYKCRVREDEHEDWGEPPPFWFVRSWRSYRLTKFRSFSLVYL